MRLTKRAAAAGAPHGARRLLLTERILSRTRAWFRGPWRLGSRAWSGAVPGLGGCLGDGHLEAEGLQLAEVAADLLVAVGFLLVPAGSEVGVAGLWVVQQVPDDDQDRAGDRAPGPGAAEPPRQAAEPLAEERAGACRAVGGLGAVAAQVGVPLPLARLAGPGAGLAGG